ncbi:RsbT co-antagonist protein RsbRA [Enhygromyxa salina]|uniref:RsbT co-antagonist protein RsbRA n=1 Tax=Enhygromyxa salina TaxID=215803 RepID=A0A2S9YGQ2_9BACT|nr:XylR N-terminal domain-containing protein [Enhygromyxa salina]PRQ04288.1 RsbT co-antagonist protein RsbRA [Enhygromyxa salina]
MNLEDINLAEMLAFKPETGQLFLGEDRMLVFRQDSLAVLRRQLHEQVGPQLTRSILARFGYQCGHGDFQTLERSYDWGTEEDRFGAGPAMHNWEGIVHVEPTFLEFDREAGRFQMIGIWRNSYEAENHLREFGESEEPVCHSLTGYASGWCSAFFGRAIVAIETKCMGCGAERCEFEIRLRSEWDERARPWIEALEHTEYSLTRELQAKMELVEEQASAISELSTPIMEIWDSVLVMPIIGTLDERRSSAIVETLLQRIVTSQSRCVVIDVTGVESVDTETADSLIKVVRAAALLGTRCVLTGLSPSMAQTLSRLGASMQEVRTLRDLKAGLKDCLRYLRG